MRGVIRQFWVGGAALVLAAPAAGAGLAEGTEQPPGHVYVTSGFDFTSKGGYFGFVEGTFAPYTDLDTSGLRFSLFGGIGTYRFDSGTPPSRTNAFFTTDDLMIGYGLERDKLSAKFLVGVNIQQHDLSQPDPTNPVQGTAVGLKVQADIWTNPTDKTLVYGLASYSTAFNTYYSTLKLGYDVSAGKEIFVGPQFTALVNDRFNELRVGAHLTGPKIGIFDLEFGAGYSYQTDNGSGAYGARLRRFSNMNTTW